MYGKTLKSMLIVAVFSVASFVLSLIKFGGTASIALDAFPGYFVAAYFSPFLGGVVAGIGHFLSAYIAGFPLGSLHAVIFILQFSWACLFGIIPRLFNSIKFIYFSGFLVILLNGCASPYLISFLSPELKPMLLSLIPILTLASALNVILAIGALFYIVYLKSRKK